MMSPIHLKCCPTLQNKRARFEKHLTSPILTERSTPLCQRALNGTRLLEKLQRNHFALFLIDYTRIRDSRTLWNNVLNTLPILGRMIFAGLTMASLPELYFGPRLTSGQLG